MSDQGHLFCFVSRARGEGRTLCVRDFVLAHLAKMSGRSRNAVTAAVTLVMRQALGGAGGRGRGGEPVVKG